MAAKLEKGDKVIVLAGKDKGKTGHITSVDPKSGKAVVDGVNIAIRATRQSRQPGRPHPQGDADRPEQPRVVDANGKATRVGFKMEGDKKVRFAKTTGDVI